MKKEKGKWRWRRQEKKASDSSSDWRQSLGTCSQKFGSIKDKKSYIKLIDYSTPLYTHISCWKDTFVVANTLSCISYRHCLIARSKHCADKAFKDLYKIVRLATKTLCELSKNVKKIKGIRQRRNQFVWSISEKELLKWLLAGKCDQKKETERVPVLVTVVNELFHFYFLHLVIVFSCKYRKWKGASGTFYCLEIVIAASIRSDTTCILLRHRNGDCQLRNCWMQLASNGLLVSQCCPLSAVTIAAPIIHSSNCIVSRQSYAQVRAPIGTEGTIK